MQKVNPGEPWWPSAAVRNAVVDHDRRLLEIASRRRGWPIRKIRNPLTALLRANATTVQTPVTQGQIQPIDDVVISEADRAATLRNHLLLDSPTSIGYHHAAAVLSAPAEVNKIARVTVKGLCWAYVDFTSSGSAQHHYVRTLGSAGDHVDKNFASAYGGIGRIVYKPNWAAGKLWVRCLIQLGGQYAPRCICQIAGGGSLSPSNPGPVTVDNVRALVGPDPTSSPSEQLLSCYNDYGLSGPTGCQLGIEYSPVKGRWIIYAAGKPT